MPLSIAKSNENANTIKKLLNIFIDISKKEPINEQIVDKFYDNAVSFEEADWEKDTYLICYHIDYPESGLPIQLNNVSQNSLPDFKKDTIIIKFKNELPLNFNTLYLKPSNSSKGNVYDPSDLTDILKSKASINELATIDPSDATEYVVEYDGFYSIDIDLSKLPITSKLIKNPQIESLLSIILIIANTDFTVEM